MSQSKPDFPDAPNISKEYEKGLKVYLKFLPKQLQQELKYRGLYDPQFIEQALGLQAKYDPTLAGEQLAAVQRRDPEWLAMHRGLAAKITEGLERGYLDPRQEAAYAKYAEMAGRGEPTRDKAYEALGQQVTGDTLRDGTASPEVLRQITQAIMAQRPGLSYGEAQDMATAVYTGQRSEALKSQRQQATGQFLQTATPQAQREASLAGFYGMAPPVSQTLAQAGSYLSSPTITGMINQTPGVTPPSNLRYVNPNAGYMGQQFALQNYQNQIAQQQGAGGGGSNPWLNALQGAGSGASMGSVGGPYGAAGGAIIGAGAGAFGYPQFSSERLKRDIVKVGEKNGLDVVEFRYRTPRSALFRGVIAEQVRERYPHAVGERDGFLTVNYEQIGIPFEKYCSKCVQFKNINEFYVEKRRVKRLSTHSAHCKSCAKNARHHWNTTHLDKKKLVNQRRRQKQRQYEREKWRNDPVYKLKCRLRWSLRHHTKGETKTVRARELLGCSVEEFKVYLQQKFKDGMAWNNYGEWHIDHIRPCSSFDLRDSEQQMECFHYTNMQPLWAHENREKWDKWLPRQEVNYAW